MEKEHKNHLQLLCNKLNTAEVLSLLREYVPLCAFLSARPPQRCRRFKKHSRYTNSRNTMITSATA